jgi:hypothetical protein
VLACLTPQNFTIIAMSHGMNGSRVYYSIQSKITGLSLSNASCLFSPVESPTGNASNKQSCRFQPRRPKQVQRPPSPFPRALSLSGPYRLSLPYRLPYRIKLGCMSAPPTPALSAVSHQPLCEGRAPTLILTSH